MNKVSFKPPQQLTSLIEESTASGQDFELMTRFKAEPDGRWCLTEIEGVPMPGYADDKSSDGGKFGAAYQQNMASGAPAQPQGGEDY